MSRERYELVRVVDVAVGDVVVADPAFHPMRVDKKLETGSIAINGGVRMWCEQVFRRLPDTDEADVLRRALRLATEDTFGTPANHIVDRYIDQARRELESEIKNV